MRRISIKLALAFVSSALTLGVSLPLHAQSLSGFALGAIPNPVGDGLDSTVTGAVFGDGNNIPNGSIDFFISNDPTICVAGGTDLGTVGVSQSGTNGLATTSASGLNPGTYPICGNYSGDTYYANATAGPFVLTVWEPTSMIVYVPGASTPGSTITFNVVLTTPSGQTSPSYGTIARRSGLCSSSCVTIEDPLNGNAVVAGPLPVTNITVNGQPAIGATLSTSGLSGNEYVAVYSGDSNYEPQQVQGTFFIENPLTSVIPASFMAGAPVASPYIACTPPTGGQGLQITLNGIGFNTSSTAQVNINGTYQNLPLTGSSATTLTTCLPTSAVASPTTLYFESVTGNTIGGPVAFQVYAPWTVATAVSTTPSSFPYGSTLSSLVAATVDPTATTDAAVPTGTVTFSLTGTAPVIPTVTLATTPLTQSTTTAGTYQSPLMAPFDINNSQKLVSADLNGDGYVDVVGLPGNVDGNPAAGAFLQVFLSTGSNNFQTEEQVFAGCAAQDFAVGDINADNIPDLVVVCPGNAGTGFPLLAYYMLGNGDGTFQQPVQFGAGSNVSAPTQVVIGTFDYETNNGVPINGVAAIDGVNGYLQIITPFGTNTCNTSPCDNDVYFYAYGPVFNAQAADFDQDGLSDIVLGQYSAPDEYGLVLPLINDSSSPGNSFNVGNPQFFSASTSYLWSMTVTDVNGDGFPDVAVADPGTVGSDSNDPGNVLIFENDGTGNLPSYTSFQINSVGAIAGAPFPIIGTPPANAAVAPGWNLVYSAPGDNGDTFVGQLLREDASTWELTGSAVDTGTFPNYSQLGDYSFNLPGLLVTGDMNGDGYIDFAATGLIDYDSVWCCTQLQLVPYYYGNNAQASIYNPGEVPTPGTYSLAMTYPGNTLYQANNTATTQITVTQGPITGTVSGPGTSTYGATVTLTATVYPVASGALPSGTITFYDGSNAIGSPVTLTAGEGFSFASISTSTLSAGTHTIYITYSGDPNYLAASNFASTQLVVTGQSIAIIFASPTSSTVNAGAMVSFQVQSSGTPLPAGEAITFTGLPISGLPSANTNASGVATFNYGAFPPGSYTITANYNGDAVYAAAQNTFSLTVSPTLTTVSLTSSANPVTYPTTVDLTATATTGGLGIPTGNIEFDDNSVPLTSLPLSIVNGNSGLLQGKTYAANNLANVVTVTGDFNHDGIPDIATLQAALDPSVSLVIMLGNGDGTFQTPIVYGQVEGTTAIDSSSDSMAVADLTGSGYADSLVIGADDGNIGVFLYNGSNTPGILNASQTIATDLGSVFGVATGNFGGSPLQGIAAISQNSVETFVNNGGGTFSTTPLLSSTSSNSNSSYTGIVAADFNQDGIADIAISDNAGPDVAVYIYNTGSAQYNGPITYPVGFSATAIAAGNLNNDAYPDLAVLSGYDNTVDVLLNDQTGAFLNSTSYGVATFSTALAIGDFNGDGFGDIAVTGNGTGSGSGTSILLSSANGAMTGEMLLPPIDTTGGYSVATADFNQDGNTDLVVGSNGVTAYLDSGAQAIDLAVPFTAGTHPLTALYSGAFFSSAPGTFSQVVNQSVPVVTWANPLPINYGTPLSATQLNATQPALPGALSYTPGIGTILTAGAHQLAVTFTPVDTVDYQSVTQFVNITVNQVATSVTWRNPARINYGTALSATQLNATATVPGAFVYDPALGTVLSAGTHQLSVTFTPTDSVDYAVSTGTVSITVNQATPTITWANPAGITYGTSLSAAQLNATGSVPGVLTYTPAAGTVLAAGSQTLSVTLTPTDGTDYAAVTKTATIVVGQSTPTITWAAPAPIVYGAALTATQLNAAASFAGVTVPGTFTYTPALGTVLKAGAGQTLSVTFTPSDATDFATPAAATTTLTVNRAAPIITWPTPAAITYGTALTARQLNATAAFGGNALPGTFTYTPALGTVLKAGGGQTLSVTFTPTDATDFATTTTSTTTITVNRATPTITWATPAPIPYGTALSATQLNATAAFGVNTVPGTLTYTPALGTVLKAGSGQTLSVTFTPTDTVDYANPAAATTTITVTQTNPLITWPAPAAITYGTALSAAQLNAAAAFGGVSVPGTFTYTPTLGTVLKAGNGQTLSVTFTPTDTTDYGTSTTATTTINVSQATPTLTWPTPASIGYGTALGAGQLNATASAPGTFAYTPAGGTVLSGGPHTLSVTFTPTDTTDYTTATSTVTVQVTQGTPIITWPSPGNINYGVALSATQLDATATPAGGTFVYNPPAGATLPVGTQTLSVTYTPTDTTNYATATATTTIKVIGGFTLTSIAPSSVPFGSGATTITLSGTGFTPAAIVQINGTTIPSTYVSPTTLTAIVPASYFKQLSPLAISVFDTVKLVATVPVTVPVGLPNVGVEFSGPRTAAPGEQPTLNLVMTQPYPVDLQGTMTLTVDPLKPGAPTDPAVQFSTGGTTFTFTIPAGSTTTPTVQIQTGTDSSDITVTLAFEANGQPIDVPSIQPVVINVPDSAPVISSVKLVRNGNTLTVDIQGYSTTRDVTSAAFDFTPAAGSSISNPEVTVDVSTDFTTWYSGDTSLPFGSSFSYSQVFNLSNDNSTIGSVSVVLTNSVGQSNQVTAH